MSSPLVSVICLCYNQARYVPEALASVAWQRYPNIECVVVNDASTDDSRLVLDAEQVRYPWLKIIHNEENLGMCASFNKGMALSRGKYLIDLAADDVMHPDRILLQVQRLEATQAGVCYSDAWIMTDEGMVYDRFYSPSELAALPEGNLFSKLLKGYFICSPTIMFRKSLMESLGGYDASLVYEDYDFFVRSSRITEYAVVQEPLTFRREVPGSNSSKLYAVKKNPHLESTWTILERTLPLLQTEEEREAFRYSLLYHWRQSLWLEVKDLQDRYWMLLQESHNVSLVQQCLRLFSRIPLPWSRLYLFFLEKRKKQKKTLQKRVLTSYKSMI